MQFKMTKVEIKSPKNYPEKKIELIQDVVISLEQAGCLNGKLTFPDGVEVKWKPFKTKTLTPAETNIQ